MALSKKPHARSHVGDWGHSGRIVLNVSFVAVDPSRKSFEIDRRKCELHFTVPIRPDSSPSGIGEGCREHRKCTCETLYDFQVDRVGSPIARIVEEVVASDDGNKPPAPAMDVYRFAERRRAAWKAPVDSKPDLVHRLDHHRFQIIIRCLQVVGGSLSRTDIGAKMDPHFRSRHESRPALDKAIKTQVTKLMTA